MSNSRNGLGVAIGVFIWGLCFLGIPKFVSLVMWASWVAYGIGFLLVLVGIMGICVELANIENEHNAEQARLQKIAEDAFNKLQNMKE
jgi:ABC-type transport system involved in multi-copper enzyme maturation permease subunit